MLEDVAEANEDGGRYAAEHQRIHQFFQVDGSVWLLGRVDHEVASSPNRKIAFAPANDVVELAGGGRSP